MKSSPAAAGAEQRKQDCELKALRRLAAQGVTAFATDTIPRTTRAQTMDVLSSMANIGGYKGVIIAASELPRYFPMFMTAAGTVFLGGNDVG